MKKFICVLVVLVSMGCAFSEMKYQYNKRSVYIGLDTEFDERLSSVFHRWL